MRKSLVFLVLIIGLFDKTLQENFLWKENKIYRQINPSDLGSYGNNINVNPTTTQAPSFVVPTLAENLISGISFDCTNKPTGPNRDSRYCDIYHACVYGKQEKTYACAQIGERFYYDEQTQRCEFASKNPHGCPSNNYYQQVVGATNPPTMQPTYNPVVTTLPPVNNPYFPVNNNNNNNQQQPSNTVEAWRLFVRNNEQFSCSGKSDGFYASRWCNVFYRCFNSIKSEFLCAKQTNGDRLWFVSHSTSQSVAQQSAQCQWPCDINRQCTSPGGILKEENVISESTTEASRILNSCPTKYQTNMPGFIVQDNSNDQFRLPDYSENPCNGVTDGTFVSNSKYCNVFHVCFSGKRSDFLCAKASQSPSSYDLWWNDQTKQCEWPCKLQCSKQIFASSSSASEIQNTDRNINSALCASNNNPTNPPVYPSYPTNPPVYPSYPTNPPTFPTYPTNPPTNPPTYPTFNPQPSTNSPYNPYGNYGKK